ncbi:hypothetical protein [Streptomyces sp. NBC_00083]|uniref:hypothetical protein n=1 Tax=Streptomyces sp. NBC_00083 TaxID=2975647 RepID=UPI00225137F4|nr:hypothetical protein [Streptomyces sp. NBC_00083]MCX5384594.1 hypothetical protein [Streptomyces sp. NBC_00083]
MNRATVTVLTATAVAALALTGCGSDQKNPGGAPPCPSPVRTTGGDLVPAGVRPCILTGQRTAASATPSRTGGTRPASNYPGGTARITGTPGSKDTTRPKTAPPAKAPAGRPKAKAPAAPPRSRH